MTQILCSLNVAPNVLVADDVKDLLQAAVRVALRIPKALGRVPELDLLLAVRTVILPRNTQEKIHKRGTVIGSDGFCRQSKC